VDDGIDWIDLAIIVGRALTAFLLWLVSTALLIWGERRIVAFMQTRKGPNRLGPLGLFQVLADGAKMFFKEDITPKGVDRPVYILAPLVSAIVAFTTFAVIPFGGTFTFRGEDVALQVWDPNIGMLWILGTSAIGVYGLALAGWASGSKYPLLGGVRSSAQLISYELAMSLSMAAVFIFVGSLRSSDIVANQAGFFRLGDLPIFPAWHLVPMIPAFLIFCIAAVAEAQRPPFDLAEAEGELVAGFHTEYSGAKFAMFMLAEFMAVITMSAIIVTLFLGGPEPIIPSPFGETSFWTALWGMGAFLTKVFVFVFAFIWLRGSLPRLRYDRLMDLGWKVLLPFGLAWVLLSGAAVVFQNDPNRGALVPRIGAVLAIALVIYLVAPMFGRTGAAEAGGPGGGGSTPRSVPAGPGGATALSAPTPEAGDDTPEEPEESERVGVASREP